MGTRADFYIGRGKAAEWIGSIAWDGYPGGLVPHGKTMEPDLSKIPIINAKTDADYRRCVADLLASRTDTTLPAQGWPWPWDNSNTTDYAYAFDAGQVWGTVFGHGWWPADREQPDIDSQGKHIEWPSIPKGTAPLGSNRSGIMVVTGPPLR